MNFRGWWSFNTARSEVGYYMEWAKGTNTFTSTETGKTFTIHYNALWKDQKVTDNGDGTLTIVAASPGRGFVYGPDGSVLFRDTGTTWWEIVFDVEADQGGERADHPLGRTPGHERSGLLRRPAGSSRSGSRSLAARSPSGGRAGVATA